MAGIRDLQTHPGVEVDTMFWSKYTHQDGCIVDVFYRTRKRQKQEVRNKLLSEIGFGFTSG